MVKNRPANAGDNEFDPCVRKIPWRRKWQPAPVVLPEKPHGQRSLVGCNPGGCKDFQQIAFFLLLDCLFRRSKGYICFN